MLNSLLSNLKQRQLEAVKNVSGPQLILAGAGTGKTTTITAKIAYMVERENIDASGILALTFSNEAARNMREKVEKLVKGKEIHVSTFHSFCAELIKDNADKCGVPASFKILEEVDSAVFIHRELGVDPGKATLYANTISKAKDLNITIDNYKDHLENQRKKVLDIEAEENRWEEIYRDLKVKINTFHLLSKEEQKAKKEEKKKHKEFIDLYEDYLKFSNFISAWEKYEEKKSGINALDYGDLNRIALLYLNNHGTTEINDIYRYIIIDEFQDTNYVQFELLKKLTETNKNVTVVADPNQTIYAFRGAYSDNIEEFKKQFALKKENIVSLDVNFRSTNKILRVAYKLIENNYSDDERSDCQLLKNHENTDGENVYVVETNDENEEARFIVEKIEAFLKNGIKPSKIAVLYRTHSQGKKVKTALENRDIPFRIKDDSDFLKQPEIKTALAYLYVINNLSHPTQRGSEAWWRIFHFNNSLSPEDSVKIGEFIKKKWISFQEAIYDHIDELGLSKSGLETVNNVKRKVRSLGKKKIMDISDLVLEVYDQSGLSRQFSHTDTIRNREALLNLRQLYEMAANFEKFHGRDLSMFIDYLEILDEMKGNPPCARIEDQDAIILMSIHASKGLEFDVVFLTNLVQKRFPLLSGGEEPIIPYELNDRFKDIFDNRSIKNIDREIKDRKSALKKKEERRLAYVAFTRAKKHLFLTLGIKGTGNERPPSEFLTEIGYDKWRNGEKNFSSGDITYLRDTATSSKEIARDNDLEREKARLKKLIIESLDSGDFSGIMKKMLIYQALKLEDIPDFRKTIDLNWSKIDPEDDANSILSNIKKKTNGLKFDPTNFTFSESSIKIYEKCPKQYELAELLRLPGRSSENSTKAMNIGSYIHKVLEDAVKNKIKDKQDLYRIRDEVARDPEYKDIDIDRATEAFDVFWERNKNTICNNKLVENKFTVQLGGFIFKGRIDRVDLIPGTQNEVEIIDYKTGKYPISTHERSKQLLLYSRGLEQMYPQYKVKKLTLELLSQPRPQTFELKDGEFCSPGMKPLDNSAIDSMIEIAEHVAHDYEHGFNKTGDESNCKDCGYRLYCGD